MQFKIHRVETAQRRVPLLSHLATSQALFLWATIPLDFSVIPGDSRPTKQPWRPVDAEVFTHSFLQVVLHLLFYASFVSPKNLYEDVPFIST